MYSIYRVLLSVIKFTLIVSYVHNNTTHMPITPNTTTLEYDNATIFSTTTQISDTACPYLCNCFWRFSEEEDQSYANGDLEQTTGCTARGLTVIPTDIHPSTYTLWLNSNNISVLQNGCLRNLTSLYKLDLSDNQLILMEPDAFQGLHGLRWLWLDGAIQPQAVLHKRLLHPLVLIYFLGLRRCHLKEIPPDFFTKNEEVYCIYLSYNELKDFPDGLFRGHKETAHIYLDNNNIEYLPDDMFKGDGNLLHLQLHNNFIETISDKVGLQDLPSLEVLTISGNPFSCTCEMVWFSKWIDSFLSSGNTEELECSSPEFEHGVKLVEFYNNIDCSRKGLKIGTSLGVLVVLSLIIGVAVYRYRWDLRFHWFVLRAKCQGIWRRLPHEDDVIAPQAYEYDAFVSYSSADQQWVRNQLIPTLEEAPFNLNICVDYRDFIFGKKIIDNILNAVQKSRKTVLVLSSSFVESEWCHFELEMAICRLFHERQDVVIMVLLEPVPKQNIPLLLKRLMKKRVYAEWTVDHAGQRLFWEKLVNALKSSNDTKIGVNNHTQGNNNCVV